MRRCFSYNKSFNNQTSVISLGFKLVENIKKYIPTSRNIVLVIDNRWINLVNDFSGYANKLRWKPGDMLTNK